MTTTQQARDETYNGWANRETWAAALHLNNTEYLQDAAVRYAGMDEYGRALEEWYDTLYDAFWNTCEDWAHTPEIRMMIQEVGSYWRVNWQEINAALLEP